MDAHGFAVAQVGGGDSHHAGLGRGGAAGVRGSGEIADKARGVDPLQGHLSHPGLVEPARGIVKSHGIAAEGIHVLLHPAVGERKRLSLSVGAVQVDVHVAVVEGQALDVVGEGFLVPHGAVGHADLQFLSVGQLLQRRPCQIDGDGQAAVIDVGGGGHVVAVDVVVVRPGGDGAAQGRQQGQQQDAQFLQHVTASSLLPVYS